MILVELLPLFLGTFLLTFVVCSAWWIRVRVILLREELFAVRDELWDRAFELEKLNDSAYQEMREHINALIQAAGYVTFITLILATMSGRNPPERRRSEDEQLQESIDLAYTKVAKSVLGYCLDDTLTGKLGKMFAKLAGVGGWLVELSQNWVRSSEPELLARLRQ